MPSAFSVHQWFAEKGIDVAGAMFPTMDPPDDFQVRIVSQHTDRFVAKVSANEKVVAIKAFDLAVETGMSAFERELSVNLCLADSDLSPAIQAYSKSDAWILFEWLEHPVLELEFDERNAIGFAHKLGHWFNRYTDVMTSKGVDAVTNWYDYISTYSRLSKSIDFDRYKNFLKSLPISRRVIAKNDPKLDNFLATSDHEIIGIDFEMAELKPLGWDILLVARKLVKTYPQGFLELTQALCAGWGRGTDCIGADDFLQLVRIFTANTAFVLTEEGQTWRLEILRRFNDQGSHFAKKVLETPYFTDGTVEQDPTVIADFRDHLTRLASAKPPAKAPLSKRSVRVKSAHPHAAEQEPCKVESSFCANCGGFCCQSGSEKLAYIRLETVQKVKKTLGTEGLVKMYLDHLPDRHIKGSCFYHGTEGCTLPRTLRSDTCNAYRCFALRQALHENQREGIAEGMLLVAGEEGEVRKSTFLNDAQVLDIAPDVLVQPSKASKYQDGPNRAGTSKIKP